jgi:multidrug efflux pump subunit AcrB
MSFIALLILGFIAATQIPVSLMPDIDIPEITVQVSVKNSSARELENSVVKTLRRQLLQVAHLDDIRSETRDGNGLIFLKFEYGTDVDYAFVEVNEKIDRAMSSLPREIKRPRVIRANATDIPVFYLNLTQKENQNNSGFEELSSFAGQVIRKRIEQLQEVAMIDLSGQVFPELIIRPDMAKMEAQNISLKQLENAVGAMNIKLGNLIIRDGQYQYNVRIASTLSNISDLENIYLKVDERLFRLKDLAVVERNIQKRKGLIKSDGHNAVSMAIIKQSDAQMQELKEELEELIVHFKEDYPTIDFKITRDQTKLLDYSISNLRQSLLWGAFLAFIVMFFFLKDFKSPLLIGITIPTSLVISLLLFHLVGISINIISLSGLVLGIGMMIDNSIIVIDNITQFRERGEKLQLACIGGTNEVFRPMLSSVLTTCAVFIPLVFISGISGALFYDQAMAITIGLFVSLAVSVTLLPVYYRLFFSKERGETKPGILARINKINYENLYEKGFRLIMRNQGAAWLFILLMVAGGYLLFNILDKAKLPQITKNEILLKLDWNERINIGENERRTGELINSLSGLLEHSTCFIGEQQFLLGHSEESTSSEAFIYLNTEKPGQLDSLTVAVGLFVEKSYPNISYSFEDAGNIFNLIFSDNEPPLVARLRAVADYGPEANNYLQNQVEHLSHKFPHYEIAPLVWREHLVINIDPLRLMAYNIQPETVNRTLKSAFNENELLLVTNNQTFVPVILGGKTRLISEIIENEMIPNGEGELIPLRNLISTEKDFDFKTIVAGQEGEYFPINIKASASNFTNVIDNINEELRGSKRYEVDFSGSIFSNKKMLNELIIILVIALLLLYFILASQFESLTLPLIVLFEVPIDIFGAFLFLHLFGAGINIMSLIGIIVMSGIIINDSILKIDTVNQLRKQGHGLIRALIVAGQRRLKPILMTSLTTILALVPFLFISGLGADLQKPLALAVIGGMIVGTLVSLYFIPLFYYYLERRVKVAKGQRD